MGLVTRTCSVQPPSGVQLSTCEGCHTVSCTRRLAAADDVLDNGGERAGLPAGVAGLHRRYLALAADKLKANC